VTGGDLEEPIITPLVRALTHAQSVKGVPFEYAALNGIVVAIIFMWSKQLLTLLLVLPFHFALYLIVLYDRDYLTILFIRLRKCPPTSRRFWQADSYKV
jgi:type IV secretion system protein VirB3